MYGTIPSIFICKLHEYVGCRNSVRLTIHALCVSTLLPIGSGYAVTRGLEHQQRPLTKEYPLTGREVLKEPFSPYPHWVWREPHTRKTCKDFLAVCRPVPFHTVLVESCTGTSL